MLLTYAVANAARSCHLSYIIKIAGFALKMNIVHDVYKLKL